MENVIYNQIKHVFASYMRKIMFFYIGNSNNAFKNDKQCDIERTRCKTTRGETSSGMQEGGSHKFSNHTKDKHIQLFRIVNIFI